MVPDYSTADRLYRDEKKNFAVPVLSRVRYPWNQPINLVIPATDFVVLRSDNLDLVMTPDKYDQAKDARVRKMVNGVCSIFLDEPVANVTFNFDLQLHFSGNVSNANVFNAAAPGGYGAGGFSRTVAVTAPLGGEINAGVVQTSENLADRASLIWLIRNIGGVPATIRGRINGWIIGGDR